MKRFLPVSLFAALSAALIMLSACGDVSTLQPTVEAAVESIAEAATTQAATGSTAEPAIGEPAAETTEEATTTEPTAEHATAAHWSYEGETGPEQWATLSTGHPDCAGNHQSPIDLAAAGAQDLANLVFQYQPSAINILNNGHTVQVNYDSGSSIELDGHRYKLLQFHFHAPSEHTINGQPAAAELHLVHEIDDDSPQPRDKAVVGVLIQAGVENPAFQTVWNNLYVANATPQPVDGEVNAAEMLPALQTTYRYAGSLTTPPCTENVAWNVMTEPIEMSPAQLEAFTDLIGINTNRPVQPLNDRELAVDSTP